MGAEDKLLKGNIFKIPWPRKRKGGQGVPLLLIRRKRKGRWTNDIAKELIKDLWIEIPKFLIKTPYHYFSSLIIGLVQSQCVRVRCVQFNESEKCKQKILSRRVREEKWFNYLVFKFYK